MPLISIRLSEALLHEVDSLARACHMQRSVYIRAAIEMMNLNMLNKEKSQRLKKASLKVRKESMKVNLEFSRIEREPED